MSSNLEDEFPILPRNAGHVELCIIYGNPRFCLCRFHDFMQSRAIDTDYETLLRYLEELSFMFEDSRRNPELLPAVSRDYCLGKIRLNAISLEEKLREIFTIIIIICELAEVLNHEIRNNTALGYYLVLT